MSAPTPISSAKTTDVATPHSEADSPSVDLLNVVPWVRIVVVTFNSGHYTQSCLDALAAQTEGDFEVVVLDNCSVDGMVERLELPDERFSVVYNPRNTGFAGGSNAGLRGARTPFVMTLNPDTRLEPACLAELRRGIANNPGFDMFSPVLWRDAPDAPPYTVLDGAGDSLSAFVIAWRNGYGRPLRQTRRQPTADVVEVFGPTGAAGLYRRRAFESEGGFAESFFCYFEDVDLALRLRARGHRALLCMRAQGHHVGGHSTDALPGFAVRQTSANALSSLLQSSPWPLLPVMLCLHIVAHGWFQFRNRRTPRSVARRQGLRRGIRAVPDSLRIRASRPPYALGTSWRVARRLSWRVIDVNRRRFKWWTIE